MSDDEYQKLAERFYSRLEQPIQTSHIFPPIPDRRFDWSAYREPEWLVGYGRTEAEAIEDLKRIEQDIYP